MRDAISQWIEWTRTTLTPGECAALLAGLTLEQKVHLLGHDYVFGKGIGVLWKAPAGGLQRRARFTHGIHFETARGGFYIDSEGNVRELRRAENAPAKPSPLRECS